MPTNIETTCVLWLNKIMKTVLNCVDNECDSYAKQVITKILNNRQ